MCESTSEPSNGGNWNQRKCISSVTWLNRTHFSRIVKQQWKCTSMVHNTWGLQEYAVCGDLICLEVRKQFTWGTSYFHFNVYQIDKNVFIVVVSAGALWYGLLYWRLYTGAIWYGLGNSHFLYSWHIKAVQDIFQYNIKHFVYIAHISWILYSSYKVSAWVVKHGLICYCHSEKGKLKNSQFISRPNKCWLQDSIFQDQNLVGLFTIVNSDTSLFLNKDFKNAEITICNLKGLFVNLFDRSTLIFWILMGCRKADFGWRSL